jgi:transposase
VIDEGSLSTTREGFRRFAAGPKAVIAMEVGTHSPWVSRLLKEYGHEVLVANARKLRMIYANRNKNDKVDARMLARVARMDRTLLAAIEHRPQPFAQDLAIVRSRDVLVRCRTQLISHVRGAVKSSGTRLKSCESECFARKAPEQMPDGIRQAMSPVLVTIELLTQQIRDLEAKVDELGETTYPETKLLRQVTGVGPLIALVFVLTIQDPRRFARSRDVGPYVGLVPARSQSGRSDPQLRITKEGDMLLRRLLVQGAHYILGRFGPDCDLRRFGLALAERGGGNARKRAVVAVARKLAVLLHRLWQSGEVYEPLRREVAATATGANSGEPTKQGARAA